MWHSFNSHLCSYGSRFMMLDASIECTKTRTQKRKEPKSFPVTSTVSTTVIIYPYDSVFGWYTQYWGHTLRSWAPPQQFQKVVQQRKSKTSTLVAQLKFTCKWEEVRKPGFVLESMGIWAWKTGPIISRSTAHHLMCATHRLRIERPFL